MGMVQHIYGINGQHLKPYLTRITLSPEIDGRQLFLHKFHRGDADRECHDHPADFWTFPFSSYYEEVQDLVTGERTVNWVARWRWHFRPAEYAHRVIGKDLRYSEPPRVDPGCWYTLVLRGKHRREWGFWCRPDLAYRLCKRAADVGGWIVDALDRPRWVHVFWKRYVFPNDGTH